MLSVSSGQLPDGRLFQKLRGRVERLFGSAHKHAEQLLYLLVQRPSPPAVTLTASSVDLRARATNRSPTDLSVTKTLRPPAVPSRRLLWYGSRRGVPCAAGRADISARGGGAHGLNNTCADTGGVRGREVRYSDTSRHARHQARAAAGVWGERRERRFWYRGGRRRALSTRAQASHRTTSVCRCTVRAVVALVAQIGRPRRTYALQRNPLLACKPTSKNRRIYLLQIGQASFTTPSRLVRACPVQALSVGVALPAERPAHQEVLRGRLAAAPISCDRPT